MTEQIDDVERGYYVYIHRDRTTGVPFYVGKGRGQRAHSDKGHNPDWKKLVDSLPSGYDVEIVEEDLTEAEAYDLERATIRKYGHIKDGGTLVNVTGGGMLDMGECVVELEFSLPEEVVQSFNSDSKDPEYRPLSRVEKSNLSKEIQEKMAAFHSSYLKFVDLDDDDREQTDFEMELEDVILQFDTSASQLSRRKISMRDFGDETDYLTEILGSAIEDLDDSHEECDSVVAISAECLKYLREVLDRITQ